MPFELLPARTSSKFVLQVIFSLSGFGGFLILCRT